jgi:hypothetical protein
METAMSNHPRKMQQNLRLSLVINVIAPFVVYEALLHFHVGMVVALIWSATIPLVDTLYTMVVKRRLDWLGAFSILSFALQLAVSAFLGGNTLVIEANGLLTSAPLGIAFLVSALIDKPLLIPLRQAVLASVTGPQAERLAARPADRKQMRMLTGAIGLIFLLHSAVILVLALSLPTASFLIASKLVTWGGLVVLFLFGRSLRKKLATRPASSEVNHA